MAAAVLAGSLALPASHVVAASAVDQSYAASGTVDLIHDVITAAQTFTTSQTGLLTRVDLSIGRLDTAGALVVTIQTTAGGKPTGTILATATVAQASVADDGDLHSVSVALTPTLSTAGTVYAVVLAAPNAPADTAWFWATDSTNGYVGGTALEGDTKAGTWTIHATDDRTFATWVDTTPCAPGTYSDTGFGTCTAADPGHFAAGPGATGQTPCDLGTYQPDPGAAACLNAPVGSYVDSTGATAATACPPNTTTAGEGSTSVNDCRANDPPSISCIASPGSIWPPSGQLVDVSVAVTTAHASGFRLVSATASEGAASDLAGWTAGTADTAGQVRATRLGTGPGRTYAIQYEAFDDAGATASCTAMVFVPHDASPNLVGVDVRGGRGRAGRP
jgi:hypothetical protein